jgi:hypothetical protein
MKDIKPRTSKGPAGWLTGDVHPTIILMGGIPLGLGTRMAGKLVGLVADGPHALTLI